MCAAAVSLGSGSIVLFQEEEEEGGGGWRKLRGCSFTVLCILSSVMSSAEPQVSQRTLWLLFSFPSS